MNRFGISSLVAVLLGLYAFIVISFVQLPAHGQGQTLPTRQMHEAVSSGQGQPLPTRHVREAVSRGQAARVGRLPATQSLKLSIALPLRNESQLDQVLQQLYDPRSPFYHQFLSAKEFTEQFGPSQDDYDAVIGFAQSNGLTVKGTAANRMIVDVTGPVAHIEAAFHVNMGVYQHPTENRTFYAPDQEPTADLPVALWHITGLDNFSIPRPASLRRAPEAQREASGTGSGPSGSYIGSDMRAAYYGGTALTGSGQSVGVLAFGTWTGAGDTTYSLNWDSVVSDVTSYFSSVGQTFNPSILNYVSTDGFPLNCAVSCGDVEQASDIEEAISMAPGLSQVIMYVAESSDASVFNRMASDNIAKSLSCSWYWYPDDPTQDDPYFKEFAAQGQSLFVAAGDFGSFPNTTDPYYYPAEDAYVTTVGGTVLTTNGPGGAWESETAWSHGGGGISPDGIAIPYWQQAPGVSANGGSTIYRNIPDVAAEAAYDNNVCYSGNEGGDGPGLHCDDTNWGGTSFSAPRWAGYAALVNQQSMANTGSTVGFMNPAIYTIGLGASYGNDFHDITSGSNGGYSAETGYDLVTGWGSPMEDPNGTRLISDLVNLSPRSGSLTVTISPAGAVSAGAKWNVDGGTTWYASGAVVSNLSVGSHTVAFSGLQGWTAPSSQTVTIPVWQTTSLGGTYVQQSGSLTVTISPVGAVRDGAIWSVDGGSSLASGSTISNLSAGSHTLAFSGLQGWTAPSSQTVTITGGQTASTTGTYIPFFTASPTSGKAPLKVHFSNASIGIFNKSLWNFGDRKTSKIWNPTHAYSKAGTYTVTLTVTGASGTVTCTQPGYITAYTAPKARLSAAPRSGDAPLVVNFRNESTGNVTSWLWNFGDGSTSTGVNPTHTYNSPGTYRAELTVYGPGGSNSKTMSIKVK
jgi:PKD repeat protein